MSALKYVKHIGLQILRLGKGEIWWFYPNHALMLQAGENGLSRIAWMVESKRRRFMSALIIRGSVKQSE